MTTQPRPSRRVATVGAQLPAAPTPSLESLRQRCMVSTGTETGSSYWSEAQRCQRAHYLKHRVGLSRIEQPFYFALGSAVHAVLQYTAQSMLYGHGFPAWEEVLRDAVQVGAFGPETAEACDEARRIVRGYFMHWSAVRAGYAALGDIEAVETYLQSKVIPECTTRADAIIRSDTGQLVVVDHKTRKSIPTATDFELARELVTNPQFLMTAYLVREKWRETPTFVVNMIGKAQTLKFRRLPFALTNWQLDQWASEHSRMADQFRMLQQQAGAPPMNYGACVPFGGDNCWAFDWCHTAGSERLYRLRVPHRKGSEKNGKK